MWSRAETAQLKQAFWTAFGQYMAPVLSADGEKVSWLNYKTGEKHVFFRMKAEGNCAEVAIEITHNDVGIRQLYYEQFQQVKSFLPDLSGNEWHWQPEATDDYGKPVSRIFVSIEGASVFRKEDWPTLISFFKAGITTLDGFWSNVKYSFEALR